MLKLKDVSAVENIRNESDFYVRIKIGFEGWYKTQYPICYWSTGGGPQKSLIEIRIINPTGAICAFTVVSMPKVHNQEAPNINKNVIEKIGLPLFEISSWQEDRYYMEERTNEARDFEIYATHNSVSILFSYNEIALNIINGPIIFGFDNNNSLCSIKIKEMTLNKEGFLEEIQKPAEETKYSLPLKKNFTSLKQKNKSCILNCDKWMLAIINQEIINLSKHKKIDLEKPIFKAIDKLSQNTYGLNGYDTIQINLCDFLHAEEEFFDFASLFKEAIDSAKQKYLWDNETFSQAAELYNTLLNSFSK